MPNGPDLRSQFEWSRRAILISYIMGAAGFFGTMLLWVSYNIGGLVTGLMILFLAVFTAVGGTAGQVNALYFALRGTRDESDFTEDLRKGLTTGIAPLKAADSEAEHS